MLSKFFFLVFGIAGFLTGFCTNDGKEGNSKFPKKQAIAIHDEIRVLSNRKNKMTTEKPNEIYINTPIFFQPQLTNNTTKLEKVIFTEENNQWTSFKMIIITDNKTTQELENKHYFHNTPNHRLETVENGFNETLPIHIELSLEQVDFHLLPQPNTDIKKFFQNLPKTSKLLQENIWKAVNIWQEHPLAASIGGGVIRVGYRTIFSKPQNRIDSLKRQGIVSKAIVTALIESRFPVHFKEENQAFEVQLATENQTYTAKLKPYNERVEFALTLISTCEITKDIEEPIAELIQSINQEISVGEFLIENNCFAYSHHIEAPQELATHHWISETLLAGVSLIQHYIPQAINIIQKK